MSRSGLPSWAPDRKPYHAKRQDDSPTFSPRSGSSGRRGVQTAVGALERSGIIPCDSLHASGATGHSPLRIAQLRWKSMNVPQSLENLEFGILLFLISLSLRVGI